jgi:succinate dehydrogenase / fumarate reductase flavoprotein subunit
LEFGELIAIDAQTRNESCGCHFREEYQTPDNEALRNDQDFAHVAVFEYQGDTKDPIRHKEDLHFENVKPSQRSYK